MKVDLRGRDFLKLLDFNSEEIRYLLDLAKKFKALKKKRKDHRFLKGKNIVLLFEKTSTRTRCSFEVAAMDLGMGVTYLDQSGSQIGNKESVADTARVLSRIYDGIEYRGFKQLIVEELAKYADVPVWNGLTDEFHPTQMLADFLTLEEKFGYLAGLNLTFVGDARNNAGNSLMVMSAKMGVNFTACGPRELWPENELVEICRKIASDNGSTITITDDVEVGAINADAIYADVWVSLGEPEDLWAKRIELLKPYQVNQSLMSMAKPTAKFLHALPSFHDRNTSIGEDIYQKFGLSEMEVTDEVFESEKSVVFDEAENRLHTIKAVVYATLADKLKI